MSPTLPSSVQRAALALVQARSASTLVDAGSVPLSDPAEAYAVQDAVAQALQWFGGRPAGHWKSGGPHRDAVLTHAPLPPAGVWASPADASAWPFHLRGIEAEIALRLGQDVDAARAATLDLAAAARLVDAMTVSIELVDTRWQQALDAPALHKLADLQSHAALVLGSWVPFQARDWGAQRCTVQIGAATHHFQGSHSMGDPAYVLPAWLRHATRAGAVLPAGTVLTTGTWCGILFAQPGDQVSAAFEGVGQASVRL